MVTALAFASPALADQAAQKIPAAPLGSSPAAVAIDLGEKVFAAQAGLPWKQGDRLRAASASTPDRFLDGQVTTYNVHELKVLADVVSPMTGIFSDWVFSAAPALESAPETPAPAAPAAKEAPPVKTKHERQPARV